MSGSLMDSIVREAKQAYNKRTAGPSAPSQQEILRAARRAATPSLFDSLSEAVKSGNPLSAIADPLLTMAAGRKLHAESLMAPFMEAPDKAFIQAFGPAESQAWLDAASAANMAQPSGANDYPHYNDARQLGVARSIGDAALSGVDNATGGRYNYAPVDQSGEEQGSSGAMGSLLQSAPQGWQPNFADRFGGAPAPQLDSLSQFTASIAGPTVGALDYWNDVLQSTAKRAGDAMMGAPAELRDADKSNDFLPSAGPRGAELLNRYVKGPEEQAAQLVAAERAQTPGERILNPGAQSSADFLGLGQLPGIAGASLREASPSTASQAAEAKFGPAAQMALALVSPGNLLVNPVTIAHGVAGLSDPLGLEASLKKSLAPSEMVDVAMQSHSPAFKLEQSISEAKAAQAAQLEQSAAQARAASTPKLLADIQQGLEQHGNTNAALFRDIEAALEEGAAKQRLASFERNQQFRDPAALDDPLPATPPHGEQLSAAEHQRRLEEVSGLQHTGSATDGPSPEPAPAPAMQPHDPSFAPVGEKRLRPMLSEDGKTFTLEPFREAPPPRPPSSTEKLSLQLSEDGKSFTLRNAAGESAVPPPDAPPIEYFSHIEKQLEAAPAAEPIAPPVAKPVAEPVIPRQEPIPAQPAELPASRPLSELRGADEMAPLEGDSGLHLPDATAAVKSRGRMDFNAVLPEKPAGEGGVKLHAFGPGSLQAAASLARKVFADPISRRFRAAEASLNQRVDQWVKELQDSTNPAARTARRWFSAKRSLTHELGEAVHIEGRNAEAFNNLLGDAMLGLQGEYVGQFAKLIGKRGQESVNPATRIAAVKHAQGLPLDPVDRIALQAASPEYSKTVDAVVKLANGTTNKLMAETYRIHGQTWEAMNMMERTLVQRGINAMLREPLPEIGTKTGAAVQAVPFSKAENSTYDYGVPLKDVAQHSGVNLNDFKAIMQRSADEMREMLLHGDKGVIDEFLQPDQYFAHHGRHSVSMLRYHEAKVPVGDLPALLDKLQQDPAYGMLTTQMREYIIDRALSKQPGGDKYTQRQKHRIDTLDDRTRAVANAETPAQQKVAAAKLKWSEGWRDFISEIEDPSYGLVKSIAHTRMALGHLKMRRAIATDPLMASMPGEGPEQFAKRIQVPLDEVLKLSDSMRPEHLKYAGPLQNRYVVRDVADYLAEHVAPALSGDYDLHGWFRGINNYFKASKTIFSLSGHARQFQQNGVQTAVDLGIISTAKNLFKTYKDFATRSDTFELATQHGLFTRDILRDINDAVLKNELGRFEEAIADGKSIPKKLLEAYHNASLWAGGKYANGDEVFRLVHFNHWLSKGFAPEVAAEAAYNSVYTGAHKSRAVMAMRGGDLAKTFYQPSAAIKIADLASKTLVNSPFIGATLWGGAKAAKNLLGMRQGSLMPASDTGKALRQVLLLAAPMGLTAYAATTYPKMTAESEAADRPLFSGGPGTALVPQTLFPQRDALPSWMPNLPEIPIAKMLHPDGKPVYLDLYSFIPGMEMFHGQYDKMSGSYAGGNVGGLNYMRGIGRGAWDGWQKGNAAEKWIGSSALRGAAENAVPNWDVPFAPLLKTFVEIGANRDLFTQRPISQPGSTPQEKAVDALNHAWRTWAPPLLPNVPAAFYSGFNGHHQGLGFARQMVGALDDIAQGSGPEASALIAALGSRAEDAANGSSLEDFFLGAHQAASTIKDYRQRQRFVIEAFLRSFPGWRLDAASPAQGLRSQIGAYEGTQRDLQHKLNKDALRYANQPEVFSNITKQNLAQQQAIIPKPLPQSPGVRGGVWMREHMRDLPSPASLFDGVAMSRGPGS